MLNKGGFLAIILCLAASAGCGSGGGGGSNNPSPSGGGSADVPIPGMKIRVMDISGNSLDNAEVIYDGQIYLSDADGIAHIKLPEGQEGMFTVFKTGYITQQKDLYTSADSRLTIFDVRMMARELTGTFPSETGGKITHANGSSVTIPPNAFERADGTPATGTINAHITPIDPNDPAQITAFPGNMEGVPDVSGIAGLQFDGSGGAGTTPIHSYGMADFTFTDGEGNELQLKKGISAKIELALLRHLRPAEGEMTPAEAVEQAAVEIDVSQFQPITAEQLVSASKGSPLDTPLVNGELMPKWYYQFFEPVDEEEEEEGKPSDKDNSTVSNDDSKSEKKAKEEKKLRRPSGRWVQEGNGVIEDRGEGANPRYVMSSDVTHFTPWNCDGMPRRAYIKLTVQCRDLVYNQGDERHLSDPKNALIDWLAPVRGWAKNSPYNPNSRGDTIQGTTCYRIHNVTCPDSDELHEVPEQCIELQTETPHYTTTYVDYYSVK